MSNKMGKRKGRKGWFGLEIKNSFMVKLALGFPGGASDKEPTCQCRRQKRHQFNPWVGKIPWRRAQQPTPVFLPGESPWTEEPGGLQSIGSRRIRHDWSDLAHTCAQLALESWKMRNVQRSGSNNSSFMDQHKQKSGGLRILWYACDLNRLCHRAS